MILGDITKKISFIGNAEVLNIKKKKIHTVFIWLNDKDTEIIFKVEDKAQLFTPSDLYNLELSTQKIGFVPHGIPVYVIYDDTNNAYLIAYRFDSEVSINVLLSAPSGKNVQYSWQVMTHE